MVLKEKKNFFQFFPTPEYLLLSTCGVSITEESIKFVQFKHSLFSESLKLANNTKITLPIGVMQAGSINDATKLTFALKEIVEKYGIHYVKATLPEEKAYLFTTTIDKVPKEGLRDAIAFILEENVPLALVDAVFDFDVIEELKDAGKLRVTVVVLPKKVVEHYIQTFEAAGITPVSFDLESQAIARALIAKGDKRTQMIINLSPKKTGFYVVEDGVVQFTITLPVGANSGIPTSANDLKAEMQKVLAFWSTRNIKVGIPERKIERVLLSGVNATNNSFTSELVKDFPVPHEFANPWANVSNDLKNLSRSDISQDALDYAPAIGVALPTGIKTYV